MGVWPPTPGVSLLLPFRLADLFRTRLTGVLVGSTTRGVVAIVLERSLDLGVVLGIVAAATAPGAVHLSWPRPPIASPGPTWRL